MIDRIRAAAASGWGWMTAILGGAAAAGVAVVCCAAPAALAGLALAGVAVGGFLGPLRRLWRKRVG